MDFFHTHISEKAIELATATLRSGFLSEGKRVRQFEEEMSRVLALPKPVAVNSGTSALHLALEVAGVGRGDEVILPPQTFVASGLAIMMCGAIPVFADIQPQSGNIDPQSIRTNITPRTKALMPVHWGGYPCDMDDIDAIAKEHGLAVVEDAAHALGATYKGRPIGTLSRFTAFSFQAIKHLTTGDGGLVCCLDDHDFRELRRRRWFGIDRERDQPSILGERVYDLNTIGYKYHLNDLAAAVGLGNLVDVQANLARHREIAGRYGDGLRNLGGLRLLEEQPDRKSSCWLFTILVDQREQFVRAMKGRGIPTSVVHQRIDRNRLFGGIRDDLSGQALFDAKQIALPIHVGLSDSDVDRVMDAIRAGW